MGGLGNYMFQIAAAYSYSLRNNKVAIFDLENARKVHKHIETYSGNIFSKINTCGIPYDIKLKVIMETGFSYKELPTLEGNVTLNGYFQSEKYFIDFEKEIKDLFRFKVAGLNPAGECSIHVRRGDYLNLPNHHPVQDMKYYNEAISKFEEGTKFLIFSDDMDWCKNEFISGTYEYIFVEGNNDYTDLYMMSKCDNNIISNSTFSWWGAWLNENVNKKVIAPKKWFGPAYEKNDTKDLYCKGWEII